MSITVSTISTDEIVSAGTFHGEAHTMLTFNDRYGCSRVSLHRVPHDVAEATAKAFNDAMAYHNSLCRCETCGNLVESVDEADQCDDCIEAYNAIQIATLKPQYDAEKRAGLTDTPEEYAAKMRDAGRGHLLGGDQ